jgi:hypothetical protein
MFSKRLLAVSLLLSFMTMSSVAHAGPTITDKSYWPGGSQYSPAPTEIYALDRGVARSQAYTDQYRGDAVRSCTWTGGPKSTSVKCSR